MAVWHSQAVFPFRNVGPPVAALALEVAGVLFLEDGNLSYQGWCPKDCIVTGSCVTDGGHFAVVQDPQAVCQVFFFAQLKASRQLRGAQNKQVSNLMLGELSRAGSSNIIWSGPTSCNAYVTGSLTAG